MAKICLPKGSGKWLKVREKSVKSQGILKWILSGNPVEGIVLFSFLSRNICFGYSKEPSQLDGSLEHPKHMLKENQNCGTCIIL